jgi:hypothetical protein
MDTSTTPRFIANDDNTVTDTRTGLMWSRGPLNAKGLDQRDCEMLASGCTLGGYSDWHLPTREELVTLVDDTRHDPAIDTDAFPGVTGGWYWTSTPTAWSASVAWFVDFGHGGVYYGRRDGKGFALAVRRPGQ